MCLNTRERTSVLKCQRQGSGNRLRRNSRNKYDARGLIHIAPLFLIASFIEHQKFMLLSSIKFCFSCVRNQSIYSIPRSSVSMATALASFLFSFFCVRVHVSPCRLFAHAHLGVRCSINYLLMSVSHLMNMHDGCSRGGRMGGLSKSSRRSDEL